MPILIASMAPLSLRSQTLSFGGAQTTVPSSGLYYPSAVAVDAAGDVFIADADSGFVVEVPAGGGAQIPVGSGLSYPSGVAVDAAGDLFIADYDNERVVEVPAGGGAQTTVGSGLSYPCAVAVDAAGDVFIADSGHNRVVEVPAGGGAQITVATGLANLNGMAVDRSGDVFTLDTMTNRVVEAPAGGGALTTVATGSTQPQGLAVDAAGDLFVAHFNGNDVVEISPSGAQTPLPVSGLNGPSGVAVDAAGDVFVADTLSHRVVELQRVAVDFGNANVCPSGQTTPAPCSQTVTLAYNVTASGALGTVNVLTQGTPNLDFTLASNTCTGAVSEGSQCTINVTFAPRFAGQRMGALQITDTSGNVLATTLIYGTGVGPQIDFGPGVQTAVPVTGLQVSYGVAVDAAGDLFIADGIGSTVQKISPSGVQTTVASGLSGSWGVAVDGAGDVFFADIGNQGVVEVSPGGAQTTIASGFASPSGVAVDGAGDVFIADTGVGKVVRISSNGAQTTVASGLNLPLGVAVDAAGNLFIAEGGKNRVVEVSPTGIQTTVPVTGLSDPFAVAVDAAGDLFIADHDNSRVIEVPAGGASEITVASNLSSPAGLAVDPAGDVFIADAQNGRVLEVQRSQPPSLTFASTNVNSTSSDSPQSVAIQNIGNAALSFSGLAVSANFGQVTGNGTPADCTASSALIPGAACNLSLSFTPNASGPLSGSVLLTDNALNGNPATQTIGLSGTGIGLATITLGNLTQTYTGSPLAATATTNPANLSVSITYNGSATAPTAAGNYTVIATITAPNYTGSATGKLVIGQATPVVTWATPTAITYGTALSAIQLNATANTPGTLAYNPAAGSILNAGSQELGVTFTPTDSVDYKAAAASVILKINQASQVITFGSIASQTAGGSIKLTATASSGLAVSFTSRTPTVCSVSGSTAALLTAGTCTIQASQAGNSNYAMATPVNQSFTVASAANFTITPNPSSETVNRGVIAVFILDLKSVNGFKGKVQLSCAGGPTGSYCVDLPQTVQVSGTAYALSGILFPKSAKAGTYIITFTGVSGSLKNTATAKFTVK